MSSRVNIIFSVLGKNWHLHLPYTVFWILFAMYKVQYISVSGYICVAIISLFGISFW